MIIREESPKYMQSIQDSVRKKRLSLKQKPLSRLHTTTQHSYEISEQDNHEQDVTKTSPKVTWLTPMPEKFVFQKTGASWITEAQTYYAIGGTGEPGGLDGNQMILIQVVYSNLTWPSETCMVNAKYFSHGSIVQSASVSGTVTRTRAHRRSAVLRSPKPDLKSHTPSNSSTSSGSSMSLEQLEVDLKRINLEVCTSFVNTEELQSYSASKLIHPSGNSGASVKSHVKYDLLTSEGEHGEDQYIYQIHYNGPEISFDLTFVPGSSAYMLGEDGKVCFGKNISSAQQAKDGFVQNQFLPAKSIHGMICLPNEEPIPFVGQGLCLHQLQGIKPHLSAIRWNLCLFRENSGPNAPNDGVMMYMIEMRTPSHYDAVNINYGGFFENGKLKSITTENHISFEGDLTTDKKSSYSLHDTFKFQWHGSMLKNENADSESFFDAECCMDRDKALLVTSKSVLNALPYLIRIIIQTFLTNPHVYQWLQEDVVMRIRESTETEDCWKEREIRGSLMHEMSFINSEND